MSDHTYIVGRRKEGAEEHVLTQERLEQIKQERAAIHKTCPFCGGAGAMNRKMALYAQFPFNGESDGYWYSIVCQDCGSKTARHFTSTTAWEAWDKRV